VLMMVLWWKGVVSRNSDFMPTRLTSVDSAIRCGDAWVMDKAKCLVGCLLNILLIFVRSHKYLCGATQPCSHRSLGFSPVCLAILASICGPNSSESANAQTYFGNVACTKFSWELPFLSLGSTAQPIRNRAL